MVIILHNHLIPGPGFSSTSPDISSKVPIKDENADKVDSNIVINTLLHTSTIVFPVWNTFLPLMKLNPPTFVLVFFHNKDGALGQSNKHEATNKH